jgi:hypothetical protein
LVEIGPWLFIRLVVPRTKDAWGSPNTSAVISAHVITFWIRGLVEDKALHSKNDLSGQNCCNDFCSGACFGWISSDAIPLFGTRGDVPISLVEEFVISLRVSVGGNGRQRSPMET